MLDHLQDIVLRQMSKAQNSINCSPIFFYPYFQIFSLILSHQELTAFCSVPCSWTWPCDWGPLGEMWAKRLCGSFQDPSLDTGVLGPLPFLFIEHSLRWIHSILLPGHGFSHLGSWLSWEELEYFLELRQVQALDHILLEVYMSEK